MSKKSVFVGVAILILIVLGVVVLSGGNNNSENFGDQPVVQTENKELEKEKTFQLVGKSTIQNLVAQNKDFECAITYSETEADGEIDLIEGNIFTSEEKLRGDFVISAEESPIVYSMIIKDKTMFSWSEIDGEKYGVRMSLEVNDNVENIESKEPVSLEDEVSYDCKEWKNVDGSVFETPNDIIFTDFDNLLEKGMEYGNIYEDKAIDNPCALIEDAEMKAQCLVDFSHMQ